MTDPLHIEEMTKVQLAEILVPYAKTSKLASSVAEFFIEEHTRRIPGQLSGTYEILEPRVDTRTLRRFIDFLINVKGYN